MDTTYIPSATRLAGGAHDSDLWLQLTYLRRLAQQAAHVEERQAQVARGAPDLVIQQIDQRIPVLLLLLLLFQA